MYGFLRPPVMGRLILPALLLFGPVTGRCAEAEESQEEASSIAVQLDFFSRYAWRGLAWSVGPVLQPSITYSRGPYSLTAWANIGLDRRDVQRLNEYGLIASGCFEFGNWAVEPGVQFFAYPNQEDSPATGEATLCIAYPVGPFSPYVYYATDIVHYRGAHYTELGVCYEYEGENGLALEATASVAAASSKFNDTYVGVAKAAWNAVSLQITVGYSLGSNWSLRKTVWFSDLLDTDLRSAVASPRLTVWGLSVAYQF